MLPSMDCHQRSEVRSHHSDCCLSLERSVVLFCVWRFHYRCFCEVILEESSVVAPYASCVVLLSSLEALCIRVSSRLPP